jgi:molecular chaperone GrpE
VSEDPKQAEPGAPPEAPQNGEATPNGEGQAPAGAHAVEPSEGSLPASDELEAALREASESVEARQEAREDTQKGAEKASSADELIMEALSTELQSLKGEYESTTAELETLKDKHLRLQAEFENFRRRGLKEREEAHKFGHQNLVKDLLTSVDNLDRAIEHAEQSDGGDLQGLLQGVELVRRELLGALGKHGVALIDTDEVAFDPSVHEAMAQLEDGSVPANTILQVLEKGYQLWDRMLRPARVVVSRQPTEDDGGGSEDAESSGSEQEGQ